MDNLRVHLLLQPFPQMRKHSSIRRYRAYTACGISERSDIFLISRSAVAWLSATVARSSVRPEEVSVRAYADGHARTPATAHGGRSWRPCGTAVQLRGEQPLEEGAVSAQAAP